MRDLGQKILSSAIHFSNLKDVLYNHQGKAPAVHFFISVFKLSGLKGFILTCLICKIGFKAPRAKFITEIPGSRLLSLQVLETEMLTVGISKMRV